MSLSGSWDMHIFWNESADAPDICIIYHKLHNADRHIEDFAARGRSTVLCMTVCGDVCR